MLPTFAHRLRSLIRFAAFLTVFSTGLALQAQDDNAPLEPEEVLMRTIPYFSQDEQPIAKVFQSLGRSYGISIICDKDVTGDVNVEFHNITLRGILDALCISEGYYWQLEEMGYITVRRFKTIVYQVEYPKLERKGASKATVNLGQTNYDASQSGGGGSSGGGGGGGGSGGSENEDEASVSLDTTNDTPFWDKFEAEIKELKGKDERIVFDRFSGTIIATASRHTHDHLERFLGTVNSRIGQQVEIVGKIVEVQLLDQNKLGIDWSQAATSIGNIIIGSTQIATPLVKAGSGDAQTTISGAFTNTNVTATSLGGFSFNPDTFAGTISAGKISAVIQALSEQGNLNTVTSPRLITINNQTAYIKDTEDRPYFQLRSESTQTMGSLSDNIYQTKQYDIQSISIGTMIAITPQIADNGDITLDVTPAITRLKEEITSKDGSLNAPALYVKTTSTIVRLRSGETAIIGGIVSDSTADTTRGVPGLSKIPLLGRLFRSEGKYTTKTELVIFLTPRIITPGSSLSPQDQGEADRNSRAVRSALGANAPSPSAYSRTMSGAASTSSRPVETISLLD
ncbi:type II secretion system protein GspD [Ereboglobus luteus]|uniref:Type II secretory protein PulD n=1 Tax=Ereboglobus luteus TaxID=1796921 RepID=A0A2U8E0Y9_9BACT|nr:secretin N-terminal domain-containing protein [Ereboglobus luteus]AWI08480.1 type II secretory protein PulD [Ereboglobus luteus]